MIRRINLNQVLCLIVVSIAILIVVPNLLKQGMFMDGQQYACVSKNLASNKGTFWKPFLSETWYIKGKKDFLEHPPLFFFIESFAFNLLGNSYLTEKIFSLFTFLIHMLLIHLLWKETVDNDLKKHSWISIFCWVIIPIVSWVFQNNMIEELLSVFTLLSVLFILKSVKSTKRKYIYLVISGFFIFFATLTKGIPGLFILTVPLLICFVLNQITFRTATVYTFILFFIPALIYLIIFYIIAEARDSISFYLEHRLLYRIDQQHSTDYRLFTLIGLFQELIPLFILLVVAFIYKKQKKITIVADKQNKNKIVFFLLLGVTASFPLMVTMVQNKFYFFPSLPFYAIAFALILSLYLKPFLEYKIDYKKHKITIFLSVGMLITSFYFSISQINKFSRDETIIVDVNSIIKYVGKQKIIAVDNNLYFQWNLQFYLLRFGDISIDNSGKKHLFFLTTKDNIPPIKKYTQKKLSLTNYSLYQINEN